jgi:hypothetical protein
MTGPRTETDTFGPIEVPADRYWGAQTERARRNFCIGEERMPIALIRALALVKRVAADVNHALGILDKRLRDAIVAAADEVVEAVENEALQVSVFLDQRFTPPAQLISSGGVKRRVAPAGQPIARQFARDRRLRTADRPSDGADRIAQDLQRTNLFSFVI